MQLLNPLNFLGLAICVSPLKKHEASVNIKYFSHKNIKDKWPVQ